MHTMFCRAIPYKGTDPYIFISYCHADKELVYPLIEQISLDGYRAWYDVGNKPGMNWLLNIEEHLENCEVVIAFISKRSRDSNNCNKEIVYAMKCKKKIIPVLIEETDLPKGLRMQMVDLHYLERKDFSSDKALLKKCYEIDACNACKDPSGSIPLCSDIQDVLPKQTSKKAILDIFSGLVSVNRSNTVNKPEKRLTNTEKAFDNMPDKVECIPDTLSTNKLEQDVHIERPQPERPAENTVILGFGLAGEETVSRNSLDEGTIIDRGGVDNDQTVRISRNLAILIHPAAHKAYKLKSPKITLGRSDIRCDVVIEGNMSVSKVHAFIRQAKQKCYLEDANSSNGTFIKGERIEPGKQVPMDNPAIFQLNDETLILLSGLTARKFDNKPSVCFLINEEATAVCVMDSDTLPLNRSNRWPDGTLSDSKIHRAGHACLSRREDGVYLVDESPEKGNGTYLNGSRLRHGDAILLSSGDRIRLGDTTLEFFSIEIPT